MQADAFPSAHIKPKPKLLGRHLANRHEALFPRLQALASQAEKLAAQRADAAVPPALHALSEAALYEAQPFRRPSQRRHLVGAAAFSAPLAVQLATALADMTLFEQSHSGWNAALAAVGWRVEGKPMPVRRLLPPASARQPVPAPMPQRDVSELRQKLLTRLEQLRNR